MKILLLGFTKVKFMPYVTFYLDQIDFDKNEVHLVYWNRDLKEEDLSKYSKVHYHEFRDKMSDAIPHKEKLKHFLKYRKFVIDVLSMYKFDKVISLHTLPGMLVMDKLIGQYKRNYILDYRDSTFETNKLFGKLVKKFAMNAELVFTSSDAFRKYLPTRGVEIITSHNILADSLAHRDERKFGYIPSDKIRISFWGLLRHLKHNLAIIDRIGCDSRFELHYYGRALEMGPKIENYCKERKISNVFVHGEYKPDERYDFVKITDIIHNSYKDQNTLLAMGNKYYDGIIFRIPQLCMPGSYMGKRCVTKGVGCEINPSDELFTDKLFSYYTSIDWEAFNTACDDDLEDVLKEYNYGINRIKEVLNQ